MTHYNPSSTANGPLKPTSAAASTRPNRAELTCPIARHAACHGPQSGGRPRDGCARRDHDCWTTRGSYLPRIHNERMFLCSACSMESASSMCPSMESAYLVTGVRGIGVEQANRSSLTAVMEDDVAGFVVPDEPPPTSPDVLTELPRVIRQHPVGEHLRWSARTKAASRRYQGGIQGISRRHHPEATLFGLGPARWLGSAHSHSS
jgi:hypothetical protein